MAPKQRRQSNKPQPPRVPQVLAEDADALFPEAEFPHIYLQASESPHIMVAQFAQMVSGFLSAITKQSESENGHPEFLYREALTVEPPQYLGFTDKHEKYGLSILPQPEPSAIPEFQHKIPVLPKRGFVVVVLLPASAWQCQKGEDGQFLLDSKGQPNVKRPMKFLFRLSDLYLQGYLCSGRWQLFNDVQLEGTISEQNIERYTIKLPFNSSYGPGGMEIDLCKLQVGKYSLQSVYKTLSNSGRIYSQEEKQTKLAIMAVTCSEGIRRRCVYFRMVKLFRNGLFENVDYANTEEEESAENVCNTEEESQDCPSNSTDAEPKTPGSNEFLTWSDDCELVRYGPVLKEGLTDEQRAQRMKDYKKALRDIVVVLEVLKD